MTGNVNRVTRMRTATLPFTDAFGRSDLEDTSHPWYTPNSSIGTRFGIGSGKLRDSSITASSVSLAFLDLGSNEFEVTFTVTVGSGHPGDLQCYLSDHDPTEQPNATNRYLWATSDSGNATFYNVTGGTYTPLATDSGIASGSTHTVKVRITAAGISYWLDGAVRYSAAPSFTATAEQTCLLFVSNDSSGSFDDLTADVPPTFSGFTDTFTRANSTTTLGTDWVALDGTWGISSNTAYCVTTTAANHFAGHDCGTWDGTATVDAVTGGNPFYQGLIFRWVDASNYCLIDRDNLYVVSGGVQSTYPHTGGFADGVDATIKVVVAGTSITVYKNTTVINTRTLTTPLGTIWGVRTYTGGTSYRLDNFTFTP